ncbi:cytochrome C oxidase subunit IV family protein [Pseudonocardia spinosispora]|uniref:cytochrome C oxidase subunit IV family protein n=1 Tax=Pseudonocardia spinosispora TaxID=103441 RepID=UPI000418642E|nr:cytochrome C oxidase subunit IV family protein [Pseudonocardia spinosispora]
MPIAKNPITIVWAILMVATIISTWMLSKDAFAPLVATVGIFLIAAYKIRMVILRFMEVRHAPRAWRIYFEAWTVAVTGMILTYYFVG